MAWTVKVKLKPAAYKINTLCCLSWLQGWTNIFEFFRCQMFQMKDWCYIMELGAFSVKRKRKYLLHFNTIVDPRSKSSAFTCGKMQGLYLYLFKLL